MGWIKKGTSAKQKAKAGFFSNLRFRTKIMLGFMTVLVLSAINMGVAHFSFERIGDGIRSYQGVVAETDAARDIDRELAAYQLLARYYVMSGQQADEQAARTAQADLGRAIERAERVATGNNRASITALSDSYRKFSALFGDVIALKTDNAAIVSNQLLRLGNVIRYKLDDVGDTAALAGLASLQLTIKELAPQAISITSNITNFVARPDKTVAASATARLQMLKNSLGGLGAEAADMQPKVTDLIDQLSAYHTAFLKYVENTAKIDDLSTKMTQAAASITLEAKVMKDALLNQQEKLAAESSDTAHSTGNVVTVLGGAGIAFGALLAWMLGRGISRPMIGMCDAMRQLASGNFDVVLPGLGRKDEIGELARVVEDFKVRAVAKAREDAAAREVERRAPETADAGAGTGEFGLVVDGCHGLPQPSYLMRGSRTT